MTDVVFTFSSIFSLKIRRLRALKYDVILSLELIDLTDKFCNLH